MKQKRKNPETIIHRAVVQHLQRRAIPGVVWFHPPNGGKRGIVEAVNFKKLGVRPGVSDIIALHRGEMFALELKADGKHATETQLHFISDFQKAGGHAVVAEGLNEAISILEMWGLIGKAA